MRIKVLGCSGAEFPGHRPPAFLIDSRILLDAGTTASFLSESDQKKIRHILITHTHLDHIRGIPTLVDNNFFRDRSHSVTVVSTRDIIHSLKRNIFNFSIWPDFTKIPTPKNPVLRIKTVSSGQVFSVGNYRICTVKVDHSIKAVGYIINDSKGKKLLYTGDTGPTNGLWKKANMISGNSRLDGAIIEVTFPNKMKGVAVLTGHLTPAMLADELKKLKDLPKKIFITHTKPQFFNAIHRELRGLKIKQLTIFRQGRTYVI